MRTRLFPLLFLLVALLPARAFNQHVLPSELLGCNDTLLVYTPSAHTGEKSLPTVFLLHGYSGNYADWRSHMDLQDLSDRTGFRLICPDGFYAGWYLDQADPQAMQWRSFFWKECWPLLDSHYGLAPDRTFVTGLSMGGHGAMNLFLDYPERWRGAGSMSGVVDLAFSSGSKNMIARMLGKADISECADQSAVNRLDRIKERCPDWADKLLVITCGTEDNTFFGASTGMAARCREMGLRHIALFSPGRHNWTYWTWVVELHLRWFAESLPAQS